jgi:hypothetical protein
MIKRMRILCAGGAAACLLAGFASAQTTRAVRAPQPAGAHAVAVSPAPARIARPATALPAAAPTVTTRPQAIRPQAVRPQAIRPQAQPPQAARPEPARQAAIRAENARDDTQLRQRLAAACRSGTAPGLCRRVYGDDGAPGDQLRMRLRNACFGEGAAPSQLCRRAFGDDPGLLRRLQAAVD